ncbi:hypothetical protein HZB74_01175 [Candidatus Saccharibacteria bacterium]|nr:hypothetical protein [Candidatus Saccharibacteria bacterium]
MRYFKNRQAAGKLLAKQLKKYKTENCVVLSLSEGGVVVGAEIAKELHTELFLLVTEDIDLPGEPDPIAIMSSSGSFTYNSGAYSTGDLEALSVDYRPIIEQGKMIAFQKINRVVSHEGSIMKILLKNHIIILVSDGLRNGFSVDVATDFLKPINAKGLIIAAPVINSSAIDKMRLLSDNIFCLDVVEEYINTDHYYEDNKLPSHDEIVMTMKNIVFEW